MEIRAKNRYDLLNTLFLLWGMPRANSAQGAALDAVGWSFCLFFHKNTLWTEQRSILLTTLRVFRVISGVFGQMSQLRTGNHLVLDRGGGKYKSADFEVSKMWGSLARLLSVTCHSRGLNN